MNTVVAEPEAAVFMDPGLRRDDERGKGVARFHRAQAILDAAKSEPDQDAPDLPALAAKLDVIVPQMAWELIGGEDCLEILRQDAHRLAAPTPGSSRPKHQRVSASPCAAGNPSL